MSEPNDERGREPEKAPPARATDPQKPGEPLRPGPQGEAGATGPAGGVSPDQGGPRAGTAVGRGPDDRREDDGSVP